MPHFRNSFPSLGIKTDHNIRSYHIDYQYYYHYGTGFGYIGCNQFYENNITFLSP